MVFLALPRAAGAFLAGCLLSGTANAAGDPYLDMLEAEAGGAPVEIQPQDTSTRAAAKSGDAYLDMLDSEAGEVAKVQAPQAAQPAPTETPRAMSNDKDRLTAGLRFERFERELKDRFFGVYFRYKKLNVTNKQRVYQQYRDENSIEMIREYISHLDLETRRAQVQR